MNITSLLARWRADPEIGPNVTAWRVRPASPARTEGIPPDLHPALVLALNTAGIRTLYSHQAEAWRSSQAGEHVVIVTGTASGKSLAYQLPTLDRMIRDPDARALFIFPTKALAQDQGAGLRALIGSLGEEADIPIATYDGDTPSAARLKIRKRARLVISNPDMLHMGVLPHHPRWAEFFRRLRFVVIDEMHTYRGVFGSHVANVIRRLQRISAFYGAAPQFFLTSATIANPEELADRLIEAPLRLIDLDGAAMGEKNFLIYNPPVINQDLGLRRSALSESVRLADDLLTYQVQTIVFAGTRRGVELALTDLRSTGSAAPEEVRGYRSGYLPRQRRQIELGLRNGDVRAVVATNALELGIDIGSLDAAILAGYPGTIAGTWQQAGRAGRGAGSSLAVLIASANPLDQFLAGHPDYFFERSPENALLNPDNLLILLDHLRCAAFELPFASHDAFGRVPPEQVHAFLQILESSGEVHFSTGKYFWLADTYPAQGVSLRSASAARILLQVEEPGGMTTIGVVDRESAYWMVHPGAIYLHEGLVFRVEELDFESSLANLRPVEVDYFTQPRIETEVQLLKELALEDVPAGKKGIGEISVTSQVIGYQKIEWETRTRLDTLDLDLPATELQTTGYWITLEDQAVDQLRAAGLWNNDPNDYGPGWDHIRRQVRARDGYLCQNCGLPEAGRAHDVHHKVPFRAFNSYTEANQLTNLVTLCGACHRLAEMAVRVRSGLSGLAYTLRHLAPLFLMCDPRDLGVHADPQSPLADSKPAVVLFDRVPAGIGFSQRLYELHAEIIVRACELVSECACEGGCPSCVGPPGESGLGGKAETLALLRELADFTTQTPPDL
jgi:DEAD/DEAH box helicase domain-containing protein